MSVWLLQAGADAWRLSASAGTDVSRGGGGVKGGLTERSWRHMLQQADRAAAGRGLQVPTADVREGDSRQLLWHLLRAVK